MQAKMMKDNSNKRLPKLRIVLPPTLPTPRIAQAAIEKRLDWEPRYVQYKFPTKR